MTRYLIILLIFSTAFGTSYAHGGEGAILLKGIITDTHSGKALEGTVISLEMNGEIIHSTRSNDNGYFQMQYDGAFLRTENLKVSFYKEGYKLRKIKPLNYKKEEIKIELEKRPKLYPLVIPSHSIPEYDI